MNHASEFQKTCLSLSYLGFHGNNGNPLFPIELENNRWGIHFRPHGSPLRDSEISWVNDLKSEGCQIKDNILTWDSENIVLNLISRLITEARKFGKLDWME